VTPAKGRGACPKFIADGNWKMLHKDSLAAQFSSSPPDANIQFINSTFIVNETLEDMYVFCVTSQPTIEAMHKIRDDTCVRIDQSLEFFRALSASLYENEHISAGVWIVAPCVYADREMPYEQQVQAASIALIKPPKDESYREVRAVWTPRSLPKGPIDIECPAARQYLSLHAFAD
jgi:hypothetical protein